MIPFCQSGGYLRCSRFKCDFSGRGGGGESVGNISGRKLKYLISRSESVDREWMPGVDRDVKIFNTVDDKREVNGSCTGVAIRHHVSHFN